MRDKILNKLFPDRAIRRDYYEYLYYQHRSFDVKGLTTQGIYTLELEQVFVDLALAPQKKQRVSPDLIQPMVRGAKNGRRNFWDYLRRNQERKQNLVVLGPPGSGKTTLMKHASLKLSAPSENEFDKIPVLLFLRDHAVTIAQNSAYTLMDAINEKLAPWDVAIPASWFESSLSKGQCVIMLDGLDEVADARLRLQVVQWVQSQIKKYAGNQFIITSRPFGYYNNPLQDMMVLEVRPFTLDQVRKFVHNWYLANEVMSAQRDDPGVRMDAKKGAEDLIWRLRQVPVLLEMAVNPLLLTMIATVHRYRSSLPGRRVELYSEICEVFLGKRQEARGLKFDLTPAQKQRVLQSLAYHMMRHQQREIEALEAAIVIEEPLQRVVGAQSDELIDAAQAFLKATENSSGLLIEREAGVYSFSHLTFQEYLAASHVMDQKQEAELLKWVEDSWWHEAIRLYAAQSDATNIVKACLSLKRPSVPALTLAMECLEEAREVRPELRTIFERLAKSVEHKSPEVRQIASEVVLMLRLRRMLRIDETKYIDTSLVTHAEFQLFLNEMQQNQRFHQPDHWKQYHYASGEGQLPVVGIRPSDAVAFCRWLSYREPGAWKYRLPTSSEIKLALTPEEAADMASETAGYWFLTKAGYRCSQHALSMPESEIETTITRRFEDDWDLYDPGRQASLFEQAQQIVLTRAHKRQFSMRDLDRKLDEKLRDYPVILQDLNRIRERGLDDITLDLDYSLEQTISQINNPDLSAARNIDIEHIFVMAEKLHRDLEKAKDIDLPRGLTHEIYRSAEYAMGLADNRELVMYPELDRALNNALRLTRDLRQIVRRAYKRARTRIRANTLAELAELIALNDRRKESGHAEVDENTVQLMILLADLYLDMALLEERANKSLPAFEGLRLVRIHA